MTREKWSLKVKRTNIGLGLFAQELIPAKQRIVEFTGPIITTADRNRMGGRYLFELDDDSAIDGKARSNIARYINHSCRPNAVAYIEGRQVWIWSRRRIQAGEQITIDYGKEYFDQFIKPIGCKCEKCIAERK